jgi:hypothetical protein
MKTDIVIPGLSKGQQMVCILLWQCDSEQEIEHLRTTLPSKLARHIDVCHDMMVAASLDTVDEVDESVYHYLTKL